MVYVVCRAPRQGCVLSYPLPKNCLLYTCIWSCAGGVIFFCAFYLKNAAFVIITVQSYHMHGFCTRNLSDYFGPFVLKIFF